MSLKIFKFLGYLSKNDTTLNAKEGRNTGICFYTIWIYFSIYFSLQQNSWERRLFKIVNSLVKGFQINIPEIIKFFMEAVSLCRQHKHTYQVKTITLPAS